MWVRPLVLYPSCPLLPPLNCTHPLFTTHTDIHTQHSTSSIMFDLGHRHPSISEESIRAIIVRERRLLLLPQRAYDLFFRAKTEREGVLVSQSMCVLCVCVLGVDAGVGTVDDSLFNLMLFTWHECCELVKNSDYS